MWCRFGVVDERPVLVYHVKRARFGSTDGRTDPSAATEHAGGSSAQAVTSAAAQVTAGSVSSAVSGCGERPQLSRRRLQGAVQ
jgi:hypothetical protein